MYSSAGERAFQVLVPAKSLAMAKSRLAVDGVTRRRLARSFLEDVVSACRAASRVRDVSVLTEDPVLGASARAAGADWLCLGAERGLNQDVARGLATVAPRDGVPLAVVHADLPCLSPAELDQVLLAALSSTATVWVPDLGGRGTTVLASRSGRFDVAFGPRSARRHAELGYRLVGSDLRTVRADVDDVVGLRAAVNFGTGARTAQVLKTSCGPFRALGVAPG